MRPLFYWDSWAYHLPFSALLWDLGGARHNFLLAPEMAVRYDGFPLAAEAIQGALWKLTGTINATTLVNSVSLAAFALAAARTLRASLPVLVFGTLAMPMIALHAISAYIDVFVAVALAFQALAAVRLEALVRERSRPRYALWCAVYVAGAALAGNSKVTGPVLSAAITGFLVLALVVRRPRTEPRARRTLVAALVAASLLSGASALANAVRHGNPVYPFDTTIAGMHFAGPEPEYRNYPDYTARLGPLARPANWLLSITEIDWLIRGVKPEYTMDSATGDRPRRYNPARTGGYGGVLVAATLALGVWLYSRTRRRDPDALRGRGFMLALFAFLSVFTGFMPQSHELRYYLYWPLLLMIVVATLVRDARLSPAAGARIGAAYLAALVAYQAVLAFPVRVYPLLTQQDSVDVQTFDTAVSAVRERGAVCLGPSYQPRQFAYAAVFHGGDYAVEQGWTRCVRYSPF